jgi:ribosomal protein L16/L10AE
MFFHKFSNRKKLRKFKKRSIPGIHTKSFSKLLYSVIYYKSGGVTELRLHKAILRKFRRRAKRRRFKIIFFFFPNYSYSKKSTNARMGKGKGKVRRLLALVRTTQPLVAIRGFGFRRILQFVKKY